MSNIKKPYADLFALLNANQKMTVEKLMPQLIPLMESAVTDRTHRYNEKGELEVLCYYHKVWENTTTTEYGSKASNKATGLNTMCKCGVNQWTTQQREAKQAQAELLKQVQEGKVHPQDLAEKLEEIEEMRKRIEPRDEYLARKDAEKRHKLEGQLAALKAKAEE